jgi:hypothetical protein
MQQAMMLDTWFQQFAAAFPKAAEAPPSLSSGASQAAFHSSDENAGGHSAHASCQNNDFLGSIEELVASPLTVLTSVGSKRTVREQDEMDFFGVSDTDKRTKYEVTEATGQLSDKVVQRIRWMRV